MYLITLHHPGTVQNEKMSRLCCWVISERWQFISNHYVSKICGCAKVEMPFHSSQRWIQFPVPHVTLICVLLREREPAFSSDSFLHYYAPADTATLHLPKTICYDCSEAFSLVPHLLSLLFSLCQLRASGSIPHSWYTLALWAFCLLSIWAATFPIKPQLEPGPAYSS